MISVTAEIIIRRLSVMLQLLTISPVHFTLGVIREDYLHNDQFYCNANSFYSGDILHWTWEEGNR